MTVDRAAEHVLGHAVRGRRHVPAARDTHVEVPGVLKEFANNSKCRNHEGGEFLKGLGDRRWLEVIS